MISDAAAFREQDEQMRVTIAAKNELESYVYQIRAMVRVNMGMS